MNNSIQQISEIKSKYKYNFVVMTIIFIIAIINSAADYFNLFATMSGRSLLFSGIIIFAIFLLIIWLPSYIVPRMTTGLFLIAIIISMIISIFLISTSRLQFIFELIILIVVYLYCLLRYRKIYKKLNKLILTETLLLNYSTYKVYELNIITIVINLITLFSIMYNGLSIITLIFSCLSLIIVLCSTYNRMFKIHLDCTKWYIYLTEAIFLIASYLLTIYLLFTSAPIKYFAIIIATLFPHWINSVRIWREFSLILFH